MRLLPCPAVVLPEWIRRIETDLRHVIARSHSFEQVCGKLGDGSWELILVFEGDVRIGWIIVECGMSNPQNKWITLIFGYLVSRVEGSYLPEVLATIEDYAQMIGLRRVVYYNCRKGGDRKLPTLGYQQIGTIYEKEL